MSTSKRTNTSSNPCLTPFAFDDKGDDGDKLIDGSRNSNDVDVDVDVDVDEIREVEEGEDRMLELMPWRSISRGVGGKLEVGGVICGFKHLARDTAAVLTF